jgi:hypothetical protein
MEPLFVLYGVNLIVTGHDHAYSRSYPVALDKRDPTDKAPVYLTLGAGGNREQHARDFSTPIQRSGWQSETVSNMAMATGSFTNATHSHFNWVRDGTTKEGVHDQVWFINPRV